MEDLISSLKNFIDSNDTYLIYLGSISIGIFIISLLSLKWLVALIPTDYFIIKQKSVFKSKYPLLWFISILLKNFIGYILILGGMMMLVLPGQGLFTIIIGLILSNYPGKYYIEKKLISIPKISRGINWLRRKANKPPLNLN